MYCTSATRVIVYHHIPPSSCSGRDVPSASFAMHQLHCLRNIKRCQHCGATFSNKEFDIHLDESTGSPASVFAAASSGQLTALSTYLKHGWPVNKAVESSHLDTALHTAIRSRRLEVVTLLLSAGASVNAANADGDTSLHVLCQLAAANRRGVSTPSSSAERTADAATSGGVEGTPVSSASLNDLMVALLSAGCDVDARNALGDSPLQILQRGHNHELAVLLTSSGGSLRPVRRPHSFMPCKPSGWCGSMQ